MVVYFVDVSSRKIFDTLPAVLPNVYPFRIQHDDS